MIRKLLLTLCLLALPTLAWAQIGSVPYVFSPGQVIQSAQVNLDFSTLYSNALNRTGGTMTGTLTAKAIIPALTATYDIGTNAVLFRDGWFSRNVAVGAGLTVTGSQTVGGNLTVTGTLTAGSFSASSLTCTGCVGATQLASTAVTGASYGSSTAHATFTVDADGRLTAAANVTPQLTFTSTYFSSLSCAACTTLNASNISSGSLGDARLSANVPLINASTNTFTGGMIYSTTTVMSWNTKSTATNYTAASDGFVVVIVDCSGGGGCSGTAKILSDSAATPTVMRGNANAPDGQIQSAMSPVRNTDKYRVNTTTGGGAPVYTVFWVPLGTGG